MTISTTSRAGAAPGAAPDPAALGQSASRRAPIGPRVLGGVLLAVGAFLLWRAFTELADEDLAFAGPRLAPLIVSGMWVVLAGVYFVRQLVAPTADYPPESAPRSELVGPVDDDPVKHGEPAKSDQVDGDALAGDALAGGDVKRPDNAEPAGAGDDAGIGWLTPVVLGVALVSYVLLLESLGFVLSTVVFFIAAARILGSRRPIRDVIVAICLAFGVYLFFTRLLDIVLPSGVLPL